MQDVDHLLLIGLSYRTASVDLRERVHLDGPLLCQVLEMCQGLPEVDEAVIVSTCNRLELYAATRHPNPQVICERLKTVFQHVYPADILSELNASLYTKVDDAVVKHVLCVAAGLDSMILGEPQILGQIAAAWAIAQAQGSVGPVLNRLFMTAKRAGKRARAETGISRNTLSISQAAVKLLYQQARNTRDASVLVLGAGTMGRKAVLALQKAGVEQISICNHTDARAVALAQELGIAVTAWRDLAQGVAAVDVVITATASRDAVLTQSMIQEVMAVRRPQPLTLVDIAVPRNIDPAVDQLPGVHRFDIDDICDVLDASLVQRQACVPQVEAIIATETDAYRNWLNSRAVVPTITALRGHVQQIAALELEQTLRGLDGLGEAEIKALRHMMHRVTNKFLHQPMTALQEQASRGAGQDAAEFVQVLFSLDTVSDT